jgi:two-component system CheB/CheR fusion protein
MIHFSPGGAQSRALDGVPPSPLDRAERKFLELYGPPGVVIDDKLQVLGFHGRVAPYFEPVPGTSDLNVLRWVRSELHADLRRAIQQALEKDVRVVAHCRLQDSGEPKPLRMEVVPITCEEPRQEARCLLVSFREPPGAEPAANGNVEVVPSSTVTLHKREQELGRELFVTQTAVQRTVARLEAAKEELESSRLDVRSALEELQSTREELDTWRQELLAARQDLTRLQVALEYRAAQHQRALDELQEALAVTDDALVVTTLDHRVRLLSRAAEGLFGLGLHHVGQSIGVLDPFLGGARMEELCAKAIETGSAVTTTLDGPARRPHAVRITPYRALEQRVTGAALVFSPIERRKRALEGAPQVLAYASSYLSGVRGPLIIVDSEKCVVWVNDGFCEFFRTHPADALGKPLSRFAARQWFDPALLTSIETTLATGRPFRGHRVWFDVPQRGARTMEASGGRLPAAGGESSLVLISLRAPRRAGSSGASNPDEPR